MTDVRGIRSWKRKRECFHLLPGTVQKINELVEKTEGLPPGGIVDVAIAELFSRLKEVEDPSRFLRERLRELA